MKFEDFILQHSGDDLARLALSRESHLADVEDWDLALSTLESRRKIRDKVPEWYALPSLRYPFKLSAEQCSSTVTARYKASVAFSASGGGRIADLTGGLGVDSWAFSSLFDRVLYNEIQATLSEASSYNFAVLGAGGITVRSMELAPGNLTAVLDGFSPDIIFLDPARRALDGRKVFRLEDCTPDVLSLLDELLAACPLLLLKLSPMADISLVCKQLRFVREVHVVATGGECKELLLLLERGFSGTPRTILFEDGATLAVTHSGVGDTVKPPPSYAAESGHGFDGVSLPAKWLFEPGKAMMKAGAYGLPCSYGLTKLEEHTHIYVGDVVPEELKPFGKMMQIVEWLPLNKKTLKDLGKRYPEAGVTAKNIPFTSEQLKARLGVKDGNRYRIFGLKAVSGNVLIVCCV